MITVAIPERFCGGDSLRRGAILSVCTFTVVRLTVLKIKRGKWSSLSEIGCNSLKCKIGLYILNF